MRPKRFHLLVATLALGSPLPAMAQSAPPAAAPATGLWTQPTLTGDWGGLRTQLGDRGITFGLQEQSEGWDNLAGGLREGAVYEGLTTASVRVDLDKLVGWGGATFFASALQIHGSGPTQNLVGNLQDVSSIEAARSTRLYDLWLEQNLLGDRLSVRLGQEAASDEFMLADDAAVFLNASFGLPAVMTTDLPAGGPNYPLAAPFVRVKYQATGAITLIGAAYTADPAPPGPGNPQLRDASGTAFRLDDHALLFAELWYSHNKGENAGLPGTYKLGVWFDSARFPDQLYDYNGLSLANPASNGIPRQHLNDYAIYGIADQTIWRRAGTNDQSIALFLLVMGAPDDRNLSNLSVEAGMNWKAPIPGRDNDVFGLGVAYEGIGAAARRFSDDAVYFTGTGTPYNGNETVVEATYNLQATPWLQVQPDAQYVINPGASVPSAFSSKPLKNDVIVGIRATVTF